MIATKISASVFATLPPLRLFALWLVPVLSIMSLPAAGPGSCWGQDPAPSAENQVAESHVAEPQNLESQPNGEVLVAAAQAQRQLRYWTTNWSFRDINIGTLARRLARIGIAAPVDLDGTVTVQFAVSVPINALGDAEAYRITGTLQSPRLRVESTVMSLSTGVNYENGVVALNNLQGALFADTTAGAVADAGQFRGDASLRLVGDEPRMARVNLTVQSVRLSVLTGAFAQAGDFAINATGVATGSLNWVAPVDAITDATTWDAQGQLALQNLSIDNRPAIDIDTGPLSIAAGVVDVPQLQVNVVDVPGAGMTAAFNADFVDTQRWSARVVSQQVPVESVAAVLALGAVPATTGELTMDLTAQGALSPLDWQVEGEMRSPGLSVYGVRLGELGHRLVTDASSFDLSPLEGEVLETNLRAVRADYAITPEAIDLSELSAEVFGGQIGGAVRWSRDPAIDHQANLDWSQLDLRWDIGAVTTGISGELLLSTQGRLAWQAPPESLELPAAHTLRAALRIDDLALAGQTIGNASLQVRAVEGDLALRGQGALLGGTFEVDSVTEIPADIDWSAWLGGSGDEAAQLVEPFAEPSDQAVAAPAVAIDAAEDELADPRTAVTGELRLRGISLAQAGAFLNRLTRTAGTGRGWSGRGDAVVEFDLGSRRYGGVLVTRSRISLTNFTIQRNLISRALTIDLRSRGDQFTIDRVRGSYAGGSVEVGGQWALAAGPRQLNVTFSRVDAGRALMPLTSDAGLWVQGEVSGRVRLIGTQVTRLTGSLEGRGAQLFNVPLGTVRSGLTGVISGGGRGWEIRFPNVRASVARGRLSGHAILSSSYSGRSFDLRSSWAATNVDFENLAGGLGSARNLGRGNLTGSLSLDGRNITGAGDLVGRFEGTLAGTQASAVPGIDRARAYLGPIGGSALTFTDGNLRGRILRGLALIDELSLRSDRLRIAANGSIRLDNARMNIDAVAATGDFSAETLVLRAASRRLALAAAPPVGLLLSLNRLLNDRIVYLRLGGTVSAPTVNVRPVETLGRNALRYFLQEITLGTSTVAAEALQN